MITVPIAFALSLVIAVILTPWVRRAAIRVGAVDRGGVSARKIHAETMPRLGGIAIVAGFVLPLVGLVFVDSEVGRMFTQDMTKVVAFFAGAAAIVSLGVYDDLKGANAPKKFLVQFAVAAALYLVGFRISAISTPFGFGIDLGFFDLPVTLLWIVGVINAMNLIDGLDGLASGVAIFAAATSFVIAFVYGNVLMMLFMATLAGAVLGFLVFNFNPASIFMGDTGSMFLGYVIAVTAIQTSTKGPATVALLVPILALGLPIMDTLMAMIRRLVLGRSMFQADREHIHHRLMAMGYTHRRAVLVLYGASFLLALAAIAIVLANGPQTAAILVAVVCAVVVSMRRLGYLQFQGSPGGTVTRDRRHNRQVRSVTRDVGTRLHDAKSLDEVWAALVAVREPLALDGLALRLESGGTREQERRDHVWESQAPRVAEPFVLRFELDTREHRNALLELTWRDGRSSLTWDDESALESLSDSLSATLDRLVRRSDASASVVPLRRP